MPDQIDGLDCGGVEPAAEPACQLVRVKMCSEPRQIDQVDAVTLSQRLEYRLPPAPRAGSPCTRTTGSPLPATRCTIGSRRPRLTSVPTTSLRAPTGSACVAPWSPHLAPHRRIGALLQRPTSLTPAGDAPGRAARDSASSKHLTPPISRVAVRFRPGPVPAAGGAPLPPRPRATRSRPGRPD